MKRYASALTLVGVLSGAGGVIAGLVLFISGEIGLGLVYSFVGISGGVVFGAASLALTTLQELLDKVNELDKKLNRLAGMIKGK